MASNGTVYSEADGLRDIWNWSKDRPAWQRDALRRLVKVGTLTDEEIGELAGICMGNVSGSRPLEEDDIAASSPGHADVTLTAVKDVRDVNALVDGEVVEFAPSGVTIIYGDNGAGKSGYVRILKQLCRVRTIGSRVESVEPNVFATREGKPRARIDYSVGGQEEHVCWHENVAKSEILNEISVFDSAAANVYVKEDNTISYTPYPVKILEILAEVCGAIRTQIEQHVEVVNSRRPKFLSKWKEENQPTTKVAKLIHSLSENTKIDEIERLSSWTTSDQKELQELQEDMNQAPELVELRLRAQSEKLQRLHEKLKELRALTSTKSQSELVTLMNSRKEAAEASRVASNELQKDGKLEGVGQETWSRLWEAARKYSTSDAYAEVEFPYTGEGARCVLCHQTLTGDAVTRLERFEAFVKDDTQKRAREADKVLEEFRDRLKQFRKNNGELLTYIDESSGELADQQLIQGIRLFASEGLECVGEMAENGTFGGAVVPEFLDKEIKSAIEGLERRAEVARRMADSDENKKQVQLRLELEHKKWLSEAGIRADILAEIQRLKDIAKLEQKKREVNPYSITTKSKQLSRRLITDRFREAFQQEIDHFDLGGLKIEMELTESEKGVSRYGIRLIRSPEKGGNIRPTTLSEGEFRCVAIAAFLAELAMSKSRSGIVFDDPVSSLDHVRRNKIARRIAREGTIRQVIAFTHDLAFLTELREECKMATGQSEESACRILEVHRVGRTPGYCRDDYSSKVADLRGRITKLRECFRKRQKEQERCPDRSVDSCWYIGMYTEIRQCWEGLVVRLIRSVLTPCSNRVSVSGIGRLPTFTKEDVMTIEQHYDNCCDVVHASFEVENLPDPSMSDLDKELSAIEQAFKRESEIERARGK